MALRRDPVCGMEVTEENNCADYEGKHYCFCSPRCKDEFMSHPDKYISREDVKE